MDSCARFQFRSSKKQIDHFFADKATKGSFHSYYHGKRFINYVEVGNDQRPLIIFVHGSPRSLDAFLDFLDDTTLLNRDYGLLWIRNFTSVHSIYPLYTWNDFFDYHD